MEEFKNLKEIIELSEEEINNNDENVSAVLDLVDLKELRNLIARYKELEMQNKELLLRLKADGLIERDKYWINKIKEKIEEIDEDIRIADMKRRNYNHTVSSTEMFDVKYSAETVKSVLQGLLED